MIAESGNKPKREDIIKFLIAARRQYLNAVAMGMDPREARQSLSYKIYTGGLLTMQTTALTLTGLGAVSAAHAGATAA